MTGPEIALKPCPFCGGKAKVKESSVGRTFRVYCLACHSGPNEWDYEPSAIARWNTRALSQHGDATGADAATLFVERLEARAVCIAIPHVETASQALAEIDKLKIYTIADVAALTIGLPTPQPDATHAVAEREACAKALEPFASAIEKAESAKVGWDGLSDDVLFGLRHFTFGDLRRASKALAAIRSRSGP